MLTQLVVKRFLLCAMAIMATLSVNDISLGRLGAATAFNETDSKSVDEQLLEDESLPAKPQPKSVGERAPQPAGSESSNNPLARLSRDIRQAQELLAQQRSDALTQRKQQDVADALAALL